MPAWKLHYERLFRSARHARYCNDTKGDCRVYAVCLERGIVRLCTVEWTLARALSGLTPFLSLSELTADGKLGMYRLRSDGLYYWNCRRTRED